MIVSCKTKDIYDELVLRYPNLKITYGEEVVPPSITKVVYNETEYTEGFTTFNLSNEGTYEVHYGATYNQQTYNNISAAAAYNAERSSATGKQCTNSKWTYCKNDKPF